jgi:hypothetical protein
VADMMHEVAKAVKRSIKAIYNNSPWFLVIVTELEVDTIYKANFTLIIAAIFGL